MCLSSNFRWKLSALEPLVGEVPGEARETLKTRRMRPSVPQNACRLLVEEHVAREPSGAWTAAIYSRTSGPPNFHLSYFVRILIVQQVRNKHKKAGQHLWQVTTGVGVLSECWCCSPRPMEWVLAPPQGSPVLSPSDTLSEANWLWRKVRVLYDGVTLVKEPSRLGRGRKAQRAGFQRGRGPGGNGLRSLRPSGSQVLGTRVMGNPISNTLCRAHDGLFACAFV